MGTVNTLVITGYGTNSHLETAHAARLAGADRADVVHFSDIVAAKVRLSDYHFLVFPGGFLDGDDLGAAQAASMRWRYLKDSTGTPLLQSLTEFINDGKLILGICNGFQLLVKLGVLPALDNNRFERQVSLSHNDSARYEDRWVHLLPNPKSPCVFTKDLPMMAMPVRHGAADHRLTPRPVSFVHQDRYIPDADLSLLAGPHSDGDLCFGHLVQLHTADISSVFLRLMILQMRDCETPRSSPISC